MSKQMGEYTVQDIMTLHPVTISRYDRLLDALRRFDDARVSALCVVDEDNSVVGILSLFDILGVAHDLQSDISVLPIVADETREFLLKTLIDQGDQTRVEDVMTDMVQTVGPHVNVVLAARQMVQGGYRHLPVVDDDGHPVGMVSSTDFVRMFAERGALVAG